MQLAGATGFQQAHISNFPNRKRGLSLEAMDALLDAAGIPLEHLLPASPHPRVRPHATHEYDPGFLSVPVVGEKSFAATQVPNRSPMHSVTVALDLVQTMRPSMRIPRPHWQRFIAIRIKPDDASAMSPRLTTGSMAVIDRHHNSPLRRPSSAPDLFLLRLADTFAIRYVEQLQNLLLARPHNPEHPVALLSAPDGRDPSAAIIGRVCLLQVQP
jgi:transcriptional regulator with XRE-family HTH domain